MNADQWLKNILAFFSSLFTNHSNPVEPTVITPVHRKVLLITYAPLVPELGNQPLYQAMSGWNNPNSLVQKFIADIQAASYGYANYKITEQVEIPEFTPMLAGQSYTSSSFLSSWSDRRPQILPDSADYPAILQRFDILNKIRLQQIDEVWLMGYPFAGFRESRMAGPAPFFCNGEELFNTAAAGRRFVIMGFNYERGEGEMLESMAHRAESILNEVFKNQSGEANLWERFQRIDVDHPGQAEVGTVHHGPNAIPTPDRDHQWEETRLVPSRHRTWFNFPDLSGNPEMTNCEAWRDADMTRGHHLWWLKYFPHIAGQKNGISYNWWKYVIEP